MPSTISTALLISDALDAPRWPSQLQPSRLTQIPRADSFREADIRPSVELQASDPQLLTGYRHAEIGVTHGERRKDASSNVMSVDTRNSTLRQPRLAQPVKTGLDILGVLVDGHAFPTFNRESGVDPQHLHGLFPGLLKLSRLRTGKR
jgi:hypothetical protein